jgi:hypothetical protein
MAIVSSYSWFFFKLFNQDNHLNLRILLHRWVITLVFHQLGIRTWKR